MYIYIIYRYIHKRTLPSLRPYDLRPGRCRASYIYIMYTYIHMYLYAYMYTCIYIYYIDIYISVPCHPCGHTIYGLAGVAPHYARRLG